MKNMKEAESKRMKVNNMRRYQYVNIVLYNTIQRNQELDNTAMEDERVILNDFVNN